MRVMGEEPRRGDEPVARAASDPCPPTGTWKRIPSTVVMCPSPRLWTSEMLR